MTSQNASNTFGLTTSEGKTLIETLIGAAVPPSRMRDNELFALSDSLRLINDRISFPELLQVDGLLTFWDRVETELSRRIEKRVAAEIAGQLDGQTSIFDEACCQDLNDEANSSTEEVTF